MSTPTTDISKSLRLAAMFPLDQKTWVQTLDELKDLGDNNNKAFTYHDGLKVFCLENRSYYVWKEIAYGDTGLIPQSFAYPPDTIVDGLDYSGKVFNFVLENSDVSQKDLFYFEPSVNIEIKENVAPEQAFYFGTLDMGSGVVDVALVKNTFVSQSNFPMLGSQNIGAEIKMMSLTTSKYLGHFIITDQTYSGFRILTIIEKGDWVLLGNFNTQEVVINVLKASSTSYSLSGTNLIVRKGSAVVATLDLGPLVPTSTTNTIVSGTLNATTGIVTFTLSDASTFNVDMSALLGLSDVADYITKEGLTPVRSKDIWENLVVGWGANDFGSGGFYSMDLTTNYNSGNIAGFPYPSGRDFVLFRYSNWYFLLVKKTNSLNRIFAERNKVIQLSFFEQKPSVNSTKILSYFKVITNDHDIPNINIAWDCYPIWNLTGNNFPNSSSYQTYNDSGIQEGKDSLNAHVLANLVYEEVRPLNKIITGPIYTLKTRDHGMTLIASAPLEVAVPVLPAGFWCDFAQTYNLTQQTIINPAAGSGVSVLVNPEFQRVIYGQHSKVKLSSTNRSSSHHTLTGDQTTNEYMLTGELQKIKNVRDGWFSGIDPDDDPSGTSYTVGGDILSAVKVSNSGNSDTVRITLKVGKWTNSMSYRVEPFVESLGSLNADNDIAVIAWKKVSQEVFDLLIEETFDIAQNIKIHLSIRDI